MEGRTMIMNSNPSEWHVMHQYAGGEILIRVYRLRDKNEVKHSGNIEFYGGFFDTDAEAHAKCRELNAPLAGKVADYFQYGGLH